MKLDDLGPRKVRSSFARETHHQDGTECEVRRVKACDTALTGERINPGVIEASRADHARHGTLDRGAHVRLDGVGRSEVDHRLRVIELHQLVARSLERRTQNLADLPTLAKKSDLHLPSEAMVLTSTRGKCAAIFRGLRSARDRRRTDPPQRRTKDTLARADP